MEHKTYTCDQCGTIAPADSARDWPQVKYARGTYHFCDRTCLQTWAGELLKRPHQMAFEQEVAS